MELYQFFDLIENTGVHLLMTQIATKSDKPIGRLGLKEEAAGKVRVFAMVDC